MADNIYIDNIEFIDMRAGTSGTALFQLIDEANGDTIGIYDQESISAAIQRNVLEAGRKASEFWGVIYCLNRDVVK